MQSRRHLEPRTVTTSPTWWRELQSRRQGVGRMVANASPAAVKSKVKPNINTDALGSFHSSFTLFVCIRFQLVNEALQIRNTTKDASLGCLSGLAARLAPRANRHRGIMHIIMNNRCFPLFLPFCRDAVLASKDFTYV